MSAKLIVISGPSGAGIGEIITALFARSARLVPVVPVTARKMKEGEKDGVGFYFFEGAAAWGRGPWSSPAPRASARCRGDQGAPRPPPGVGRATGAEGRASGGRFPRRGRRAPRGAASLRRGSAGSRGQSRLNNSF